MTRYCALPPLDQAATRIGRGYGLGYNRARTRIDQMHAGMDLVGGQGTPVLVPLPGVVVEKPLDSSTAPGFRGYGNAVVLRHDFSVPGLPRPFFTLYAHLAQPSALEMGQSVAPGALLGFVGATTNGQFPGMGPHLHFEVRRRARVSYGSRTDTFDPAVLWRGVGIDWTGHHREAQREVGGQLLRVAGGPSDCAPGEAPSGLSGLAGPGDEHVDPASLSPFYERYGQSVAPGGTPEPPPYQLTVPLVGAVDFWAATAVTVVTVGAVGLGLWAWSEWRR